jgi:hypothetical protein
LTSLAIMTKSPVIAAFPPPVGWKLMAVASPMDAGTVMPPSRMVSARGTLTEYTPPFTLPARPSVRAMAAVSMPSAAAPAPGRPALAPSP